MNTVNSELLQNCTEKQITASKATANWLFNTQLFIHCFFLLKSWRFSTNSFKALLYPQLFGYIQVCFLCILGSSEVFKLFLNTLKILETISVKILQNRSCSNTSNLCCIFIWSTYVLRKQIFDNFMISLRDRTENSL